MKKLFKISFIMLIIFLLSTTAYSQVLTTKWHPNTSGIMYYWDVPNGRVIFPFAPTILIEDFLASQIDTTLWDTLQTNAAKSYMNADLFPDGAWRLKTGATDDDESILASDFRFYSSKYVCIEFIIKPLDISGQAFFMGLASRNRAAKDSLVVMYDGTTVITRDSSIDNAAGFIYDPDATTDYIYGVSVKAGVANSVVSSAVTPTDSTTYTLFLTTDGDGDCEYYVNGVYIGRTATAITTTTALCIYAGMINREGATNYLDIDRIFIWQRKD